jgi:Tannase and feruloyl esterase
LENRPGRYRQTLKGKIMIGYRIALGLTSFLLASAASAGNSAFAASCESLAGLKLANTMITMAQSEAAGAFTPPGSPAGTKPVPVAFCRVGGSIKPTRDSDIRFEVWLPLTAWTGRYESNGNGGFAGAIPYTGMVRPLIGGSAVAGTDDGHEAPTVTQAEWALGHPEKIIDFGYRAVHLTATISKAITSAYYGSKPKHSYFVGCSKSGQEGLMEAQRYPKDFDGIIAGAPANQWVNMFSSFAANLKANITSEAGFISPADVQKIGSVTTDQCDALDGVKDGLINDPRECRIDVASLPLTPAQLKTYQVLHDGPKTSSGQSIYPGLPFGSEAVGWVSFVTGPSFTEARTSAAQGLFANGFFSNFVYQNPSWDFLSFNPDKSPADAEKAVGHVINATDPNLTAFKAQGGKLISYHGWSDALVTPLGMLNYYNTVVAAQGRVGGKTTGASQSPDSNALEKTQTFYRLFMVPGMSHCAGGPGPNEFGQVGGDGDADHDVVAALERWVEKGVAPKRIIATKYVGDDITRNIAMTRPLCVYPQAAKYKGTGNTNNASSFLCSDLSIAK